MSHANAPVALDASATTLGGGARRWAMVFLVVGVVALGASWVLGADDHGHRTFFHSYLTNLMYVLSLGLGALFFVIVSHLVRAGWNVSVRRIAETIAWTLVPMVLPALVILLGTHDLYEWTHAEVVEHDPILKHKEPYLNVPFFTARVVVYLAVWAGLAWWYLRRSVRQDESGDVAITSGLERISPVAAILFALTVTFGAFDLVMSLYPHWFSTIYGVYYFAGSALSAFSLCVLIVWRLKSIGKLGDAVNPAHFHDLGKLMFAFVVFWAYIAFSQYMLIWYANMPEETAFYEVRQNATWAPFSVLLLVGHFALPFLGLISRIPKLRPALLTLGAVWLLVVHWFDLFWLIGPVVRPDGPAFAITDLTCLVGLGGLFVGLLLWRLSSVSLVPLKDPRLHESLALGHHHA